MKIKGKLIIASAILPWLVLYILRFSPISYSILRHSSQEGYYPIVAVQLALGVKPDGSDRTPLIESIYNDHPAISEILVRYGADIERNWVSGDPNGPPLAWALMYGESVTAKMLLRYGARADYTGTNTSLHMAVELNDPELVKMLISNGANSNLNDYNGITPLMLAVAYKRYDIEKILRQAGAKNSSKKITGHPEHYCHLLRGNNVLPNSP